jgi:hypothetical protein
VCFNGDEAAAERRATTMEAVVERLKANCCPEGKDDANSDTSS